jgi:hypothetical protein
LSQVRVLLFVRRGTWRRGNRRAWCTWEEECLTDLQFSVVFDVIQFLQLPDRHLVHLGDGGQRLSLGYDMGVPIRHGSGGGDRGLGCARYSGRWTACRVLNLLLQAKDLLGKQIDLYVLLVDLAREIEELGGFGVPRRRGLLRESGCRERRVEANYRQDVTAANHRQTLASPFATGKQAHVSRERSHPAPCQSTQPMYGGTSSAAG